MFAEKNMPFDRHSVIDSRTKAEDAVSMIREASCIFLMGGNATLQFQLMRDKGILNVCKRNEIQLLHAIGFPNDANI